MAVITQCHPIRFAIPPQIRLKAGPLFDSDNTGFKDGGVQSNANWRGAALWEYWLRYLKTSADFLSIQGFFLARGGMDYGFFLADPVDYSDDGMGWVREINGVYRLVKEYPDEYSPYQRLIRRPVAGTVDLTGIAGDPDPDEDVDYTTGIVDNASAEGQVQFQFDVPVKFFTNICQPTYEPNEPGKEVTDWVDVHLRELRRWALVE